MGHLQDYAGNAVPSRPPAPMRRRIALALISAALLVKGGAAYAQVQVSGPTEAVRIEATDATLREVLEALRANFNLRYRSDDTLDARMTGTFGGPLQRVAARVLNGYDYAMKITPQGIDVLVLRQNQADNKTVAAPMPARPSRSPAPVMTAAEANRYERGLSR
jgi:hypothetical protein